MGNRDRKPYHLTDEDYAIFTKLFPLRGAYKSADRSDGFDMSCLMQVQMSGNPRGNYLHERDMMAAYVEDYTELLNMKHAAAKLIRDFTGSK